MIFKTEKGGLINLIGDPHFGKKFVNGVPLHRRGEREALQLKTFKEGLIPPIACKTIVCVGDLFDTFSVEEEVKFIVFQALAEAAWEHTEVDFIILQGNHDVSRDTGERSSFEVLESMCASIPNIIFVKEPVIHTMKDTSETLLFFPYDAFKSALDLVEETLTMVTSNVSAAFGHWDVEDFGNPFNLVPIKALSRVTSNVITGHVHSPQKLDIDGVQLIVTGSMLPYSHGEDRTGHYYVSCTVTEYNAILGKHPTFFHNRSLRIWLGEGEELPTGIDAFQVSFNRLSGEKPVEARLEAFSFKGLFDECFSNNNVTDEMRDHFWKRYEEIASDAAKS